RLAASLGERVDHALATRLATKPGSVGRHAFGSSTVIPKPTKNVLIGTLNGLRSTMGMRKLCPGSSTPKFTVSVAKPLRVPVRLTSETPGGMAVKIRTAGPV